MVSCMWIHIVNFSFLNAILQFKHFELSFENTLRIPSFGYFQNIILNIQIRTFQVATIDFSLQISNFKTSNRPNLWVTRCILLRDKPNVVESTKRDRRSVLLFFKVNLFIIFIIHTCSECCIVRCIHWTQWSPSTPDRRYHSPDTRPWYRR